MRKAIATGQFEKCRQYMTVVREMCVIGQLVLSRILCIIIPSKLQPRTLALAHEGHNGCGWHQTEPQNQGVVARDG